MEERQDNEDQAFQQDCGQGELPGVPHAEAYRVDKKRIQPHAGGEGKWKVRPECHDYNGQDGGESGRGKHRSPIHSCIRQDQWIDHEDIRHGHEGGYPRNQFGTDSCPIRREMKLFLQPSFHDRKYGGIQDGWEEGFMSLSRVELE